MTLSRGMAAIVAAILLLGIAVPAGAGHERDEDRVDFRGVIVATDAHDQTILVREGRGRAPDRLWLVQILPRTRIEVDLRWLSDDDAPGLGPGSGGSPGLSGLRSRFWLLRVGQVVEVEGRVTAGRRVAAREITVIGRGARPPFPNPRPPFPLRAPQVFFPRDGAVVDRDDLVIVGESAPRARVQVELIASWFFSTGVVGRADVTADQGGIFVARIFPSPRISPGTYRVAVRAIVSGQTSPTTTLTVRVR